MIRYLILNNFKLMVRSKLVLALMLFGPILTIAILSSAFEDMMASYENASEFRAGYRVSPNSVFSDSIEQIRQAATEAGIELENYPDGDPADLIGQNDLAGFLWLQDETYTVYRTADCETQGKLLEYFMEQVILQARGQALEGMFPADGDNASLTAEEPAIPVTELEFMPAIDSKDYYGITETVYFIWCGIVSLAGILSSEKKNRIGNRFAVSGLSPTKLYFAKWIPAVLITGLETAVTVTLTVILFDISWCINPMTILILFVAVTGATAFGILFYSITNNLAVTIAGLFTVVWFMGFFGGSFETYMFSSISDSLKRISPIYHVNRALVEYSCMGASDYMVSSITYMCGITLVCTVLSIIIQILRKKGKA